MSGLADYLRDVLRAGAGRPRAWDCAAFCFGWLDRVDPELAAHVRSCWPSYATLREAREHQVNGRITTAAMYCDAVLLQTAGVFGPVLERTASPREGDLAFHDAGTGAPVMGLVEAGGQGVFLQGVRGFTLVPAHLIKDTLTWDSYSCQS